MIVFFSDRAHMEAHRFEAVEALSEGIQIKWLSSIRALDRQDLLRVAAPGATVLLNAPFPAGEVWAHLQRPVQQTIIDRRLRLFTIDASAVAVEVGLGSRTNTILQTCFFTISGVLPREAANAHIKQSIQKTYGCKGQSVVDKNFAAIDGKAGWVDPCRCDPAGRCRRARTDFISCPG